jgi:hypothetical protein
MGITSEKADVPSTSVARFNGKGRAQPRMARATEGSVGIKPRVARSGYVQFLVLKDLDQRSRAAGRVKEIMGALETDIAPEGSNQLSEAQRQLVVRAAMLSVMCEDIETRHLMGMATEVDIYLAAVNN